MKTNTNMMWGVRKAPAHVVLLVLPDNELVIAIPNVFYTNIIIGQKSGWVLIDLQH